MTLIASGGVVVASAALFIVLSVFAGLKEFSLQFTSFVDPDLKVMPATGKSFVLSESEHMGLLRINGIANYSAVIEERVIIKSENKNLLASIKGVDDNFLKVTNVDSMVRQGKWLSPKTNEVVAGWGISNNLSFGIFDYLKPLSLYVPKTGKGQISSLKSAYNAIYVDNVGLFDVNEELNSKYVYADIDLTRSLLNFKDNEISAIEIKLSENADEDLVRNKILDVFNNGVIVKNRAQLNDALYKMLNTENLAIYLIFTLVIIIALFNVIGAMIMMILDKKKSLNTLFNLGSELKNIKSIFFLQGSLLTFLSGLTGVVLGLIIVFLQQKFELVMLTPELAYPVQMEFLNVLIVLATIITLGVVASRLACERISRTLIKS